MEFFDPVSSSDEEYFPTAEDLVYFDDELEEDEDEYEEEDSDDTEYVDEEDEPATEVRDAAVDRLFLQSDPRLLPRIRQLLHLGSGARSAPMSPTDSNEDPSSRRRRRHRLPDLPSPPYKAGKHLLNSGEFGEIDDRKYKKRHYETPRTLTQYARFRELGWKQRGKLSTLNISRRWIPEEGKGRIVAQYDRNVYSGQFSHDGSFFYTASQDFKCRMYQTPNPSNPNDWKLYKVLPKLFSFEA